MGICVRAASDPFFEPVAHFLTSVLQKDVEFSVNSPSIQNGTLRRGARVVMEQIANLSTGNRCQGSNPCLSASKPGHQVGLFFVRE